MPGEPTTRRGRASRERIVERAAGLFAERGIAATSVDEVLAAAGAGKGQFYHYFRGRDELAAAAVGYRCAQVVAGLTEALGGVSSLAGLERALAGFIAGGGQAFLIFKAAPRQQNLDVLVGHHCQGMALIGTAAVPGGRELARKTRCVSGHGDRQRFGRLICRRALHRHRAVAGTARWGDSPIPSRYGVPGYWDMGADRGIPASDPQPDRCSRAITAGSRRAGPRRNRSRC
jgi:AcrR family transcriptional regulator